MLQCNTWFVRSYSRILFSICRSYLLTEYIYESFYEYEEGYYDYEGFYEYEEGFYQYEEGYYEYKECPYDDSSGSEEHIYSEIPNLEVTIPNSSHVF